AVAQTESLQSAYASDVTMAPIIGEFVSGLPAQVEQIQQALRSADLESLRRLVHQLKGSGGGYGFMPLTDAAANAERTIITQAPLESISAEVAKLIELVQKVQGYRKQESVVEVTL